MYFNKILHTSGLFFLVFIGMLWSNMTYAQTEKLNPHIKVPLDSLIFLKSNISNTDSLSTIYYNLGARYIDQDGSLSIAYFDTSIIYASFLHNKINENIAKFRQAIPLINTGQYIRASKQVNATELFYHQHLEGRYEVDWYIRKAFLETELTNTDDALILLRKALDLAKRDNQTLQKHDIYNRMAIIYVTIDEQEKALKYFNKIIDSNKENNVNYFQRAAYTNGATIYKTLKDTAHAIEYYKKAYLLRKNKTSKRNRAYSYSHLLELSVLENNYPKAIMYADSALTLAEEMNLKPMIIQKLNGLIYLNDKIGNKKEEIKYINRAFEYVEKWNMIAFKQHVYAKYAEHLTEIGKHKEAYRYLQRSNEIKDSLNIAESKNQIAKLDAKLLKAKEQDKIKTLELEQRIIDEELKRKDIITIFMILSILLLSGLVAILFYRSIEKRRLNESLSKQNKVIESNLRDKEVLLKEIHHRVKNNLQIVSSMLNLHSRHIKDPEVLSAITESRNRVKSMAMTHQKLYQEDNLKGVSMPDYIETLVSSLLHSYKVKQNINVHSDITPIILDVDTTIPIGLICNELITNSLKYAFPNESHGNIWIELIEKNKTLNLTVRDDGVGMIDKIKDPELGGFGYTLIQSLSEKLKGDLVISNGKGTTVELLIRNYKKATIDE